MNLLRRVVLNCAGLSAMAVLACSLGCADQNRMYEAACRPTANYDQNTGELYRVYLYFPDKEVYYSFYQDLYFWRDGFTWYKGTKLPEDVTVADSRVVSVELATGRPYLKHGEVVSRHPSIQQLRAQAAASLRQNDPDARALASVLEDD